MAPFVAAILPKIIEAASGVVGSMFPSPEQKAQRDEAERRFTLAILAQSQALEQAAAQIVQAEARSEHWLTSAWRPITMLTFVALIVARWLGWSAPGISEAEVLKLWDIVQLGLGGYVIGRSAEKLLPSLAEALKK